MFGKIIILIAFTAVAQVASECKTCNQHGFACINEKEYHVCIDGGKTGYADDKMDESVTLKCTGENEICTDLSAICVSTLTSNASPGCTDECGLCAANKPFACTSRTTYAFCSGLEVTNTTGSCKNGLVCDTSGTNICVDECKVTKLKCDRAAEVPSTVAPPTTPSSTSSSSSSSSTSTTTTTTTTTTPSPTQTANQVCATQNAAGRFPYPNETTCQRYVYCRYSGTTLVGVVNTCPTGSYFDKSAQVCSTTKPSGCV